MAWRVGPFLLLCAVAAQGVAGADPRAAHEQELLGAQANPRQAFSSWAQRYSKDYANDLKETERRFANWYDNLQFIIDYNAKHTSHWLGLNVLADLSHEEYKQQYGLGYNKFQRSNNDARPKSFSYAGLTEQQLPAEVDWRAKGAVSEVKNQRNCGSCWAFSTTGSVEGINAIQSGELVSLSEQELVDCDTSRDKGCSGGLMDFAFEFIISNGGLDTEDDYPYTARDGACVTDKLNRRVVTIDAYEDVPQFDEVALKKAVSGQPVAVAIEADQRAFQLYMGGVFDDASCGEALDHGVLVAGYGVEPATGIHASRNYWIVKNSWGPGWGDAGYIKLRMGHGRAGMCGIATQGSYPIKRNPNPPTPPPTPGPKPGPTPGPAQPVACDSSVECPPETTCCCVSDIAGFCLGWGCCPMVNAVCCADKQHCCPHDLPVCDPGSGRCGLGSAANGGDLATSVPWSTKLAAKRRQVAPWVRAQHGSSRRQEDGAVATS